MVYVYPAIFQPSGEGCGYAVEVPDLPAYTCGDSLAHALDMAEDAIAMWLVHSEDNGHPIPAPSKSLPHESPQFVNLVKADTDAWRRVNDNRAVRKNLTIPAWLNYQAEAAHVNFSSILQDALKTHLKIAQ
ncbi:MAG: type II toxin-antitoxin system HicB family antitoxin [Defluviitaleaceae bacterium]|nr:type II toxin-antitoxin system HicB family antitoxin [Defluviitaleaceae bacterium]